MYVPFLCNPYKVKEYKHLFYKCYFIHLLSILYFSNYEVLLLLQKPLVNVFKLYSFSLKNFH